MTVEQIKEKWIEFEQITSQQTFQRPGVKELLSFYKNRIATAPASSVVKYHNCFVGGFLDHTLRVYNFSLEVCKLWKTLGFSLSKEELNELKFSAIFHDLGKLGMPYEGGEYYIKNQNNWEVEKRGIHYSKNNIIPFMKVSDRSLFILNHFGVKLSENEYLSIKTHDGLYEDQNKDYFMSYDPQNNFKSNINLILHHADLMAAKFEMQINR